MTATQEWKLSSLKEAGVVLIDCDHRTPPAVEVGYPYIAIPQLKNGHINLSGVRKISPDHFEEWTRKAKPQHHDVILSRRCNPGETAHVPENLKCALGQNLVLLRADGKKVVPQYLRWITQGPLWWEQISKFINVGAVFDSLRCADVPKFELPIPPIPEQRAIAAVLGALDDKIELNSRMNATLEAAARALFKSWFVDFDPVKAKMAGSAPFDMDVDTAALFPTHLTESELGDIPEGWEVKKFEDFIERLPSGKKYDQKNTTTTGKIPVLDQGKSGVIGYHDNEPDIIADKENPLFVFANHTCYMRWVCEPSSAIQNVIPLRGKNLPIYWAWYATVDVQKFQEYKGHWPDFAIKKAIIPDADSMKFFSDIVKPFVRKQFENLEEIKSLERTRDYLLPKLISGEIRIPDAEKFIGNIL